MSKTLAAIFHYLEDPRTSIEELRNAKAILVALMEKDTDPEMQRLCKKLVNSINEGITLRVLEI